MGHRRQLRGKPWAAGGARSWEVEFQGKGGARVCLAEGPNLHPFLPVGARLAETVGGRRPRLLPTEWGWGGSFLPPHTAGDRPVRLHPANTNRLRRCSSFWPEIPDKNRARTSIRKLTRRILSAAIHGWDYTQSPEPQQLRLRGPYFRLSRQKPALPTRHAVTP